MECERLTMTVKEMAHVAGVCVPTAHDMTNIPGFPVVRIGRRKLIPIAAFERWLDQQASGTEQPVRGRR